MKGTRSYFSELCPSAGGFCSEELSGTCPRLCWTGDELWPQLPASVNEDRVEGRDVQNTQGFFLTAF